ncbi:dTDP-4-dehydrorhamnose 3,5-epimerase family protein [candidate division KSB1 bacterium]|nr:dTDP-4-dehydrorhamnose 3,5-epimerase family protein [candidate division KSB1 bacterium]MBL7095311.1 dTDP-4-dehydrorhamnose 3,5-epimerase family protein [candidate division KSB1 bacterium]
MKIISIKTLEIPEIKVIRFARFCDHRGYFTEPYRKSDFANHENMDFMGGIEFLQANESFSKKGTIRGLHFQWNPYMGKMVRTLSGRMVDIVLDIRKGSSTYGKIIAYDMPTNPRENYAEWIWVPPGFAHGNFFTEDSLIEYFCSGEYSPGCEAGISPLANDIDWSMCDTEMKQLFDSIVSSELIMTEKDKNGLSMNQWTNDSRSENFLFGQL